MIEDGFVGQRRHAADDVTVKRITHLADVLKSQLPIELTTELKDIADF